MEFLSIWDIGNKDKDRWEKDDWYISDKFIMNSMKIDVLRDFFKEWFFFFNKFNEFMYYFVFFL